MIIIVIYQKNQLVIRATVKTYEQTGTYVFLKLFKKKPDHEFTLVQKQEEFELLLWKGKSVLQPANAKKVTKKSKKRPRDPQLLIRRQRATKKSTKEKNKENIDPNKYGGSNV